MKPQAYALILCATLIASAVTAQPPLNEQWQFGNAVTLKTRFGKGFGLKFPVEGRILKIMPGQPVSSQRREMYRFFDTSVKPSVENYDKGTELQILDEHLLKQFEAELKRDPDRLFRMTVYETIYAYGTPGEGAARVDDELGSDGSGYSMTTVLVLRAFKVFAPSARPN